MTNALERSGRDCLLEVRDDGRGENGRRFSSQTTESGRDARFTILWLINQHATGRYDSRTLASDEPVPLTESGEKISPLIDAGAVVNLLKFAQQIDNARIVGIDVGCIQRLQQLAVPGVPIVRNADPFDVRVIKLVANERSDCALAVVVAAQPA
ncbi:hypothetical protein [Paraburkholderia sp. 31.1]|uniref:hypothetical protein n=1 Tax=Paraburkholderia sp. 31.1 TaxID=2615205 RepID=UPI0016551989|nr:hypothetical protein [Paraburkholderia sp. 31.1]